MSKTSSAATDWSSYVSTEPFLHYVPANWEIVAGHGCQTLNRTGSEPDGMDEGLKTVPSFTSRSAVIDQLP